MNRRGFTLVELIVVIGIIATLTTIATLSWNKMTAKSAIEGQIKTVYADLMKVRLEALYEKRERRVEFVGNRFNVYSSNIHTSAPFRSSEFKFANFTASRPAFIFSTSGLASGFEGSVCVKLTRGVTDAYVDSLVITDGRISLGKRNNGAACESANIDRK